MAALTLARDVKTTWSFSAFTVLICYTVTNLSALCLPADKHRFPRWISVLGRVGCLSLSAFIPFGILLTGLLVIAVGVVRHFAARKITGTV